MSFLSYKLGLTLDILKNIFNILLEAIYFIGISLFKFLNIILWFFAYLLSLSLTNIFLTISKIVYFIYYLGIRLLVLALVIIIKAIYYIAIFCYETFLFIFKSLDALRVTFIYFYKNIWNKLLILFRGKHQLLKYISKCFNHFKDISFIATDIKHIGRFLVKIISKVFGKINRLLYKIYSVLLIKSRVYYLLSKIIVLIKATTWYITRNICKLVSVLLIFFSNSMEFVKSFIAVIVIFGKTLFSAILNIFKIKFWKDNIKGFLNVAYLVLLKLKQVPTIVIKEVIVLLKYTPHIIKEVIIFVLVDLFKVKKIYIWCMRNLFSSIVLFCSFIIVVSATITFYNKPQDLDEISRKYAGTVGFAHVNDIFNIILNSDVFKPVMYYNTSVTVSSGKTLSAVLQQEGVNNTDINKIVSSINKTFNVRNIKPNWVLNITVARSKDWDYNRIQKISIPVSNTFDIVTEADSNYDYVSYKNPKKLTRYLVKRRVIVQNSIYSSMVAAGIPDSITVEALQVLSWEVDFQREIRSNDKFEVVFECLYNQNDELVTCDNILYALLKGAVKTTSFYKYRGVYYHDDGSTVAKTLIKTPINNARLTSTFGVRNHPVLGYTVLHKGVDFAAPIGTPIYASGNGIIETIQYSNTYGNFIKIKHNDHLGSLYAHMQRFASGLRKGDKVQQWQVIGYLGGTGRVTGPHLHYEVHVNGKQVNPLTIQMPSDKQLTGIELKNFDIQKTNFDNLLIKIPLRGKTLSPISENVKNAGIDNI